jgi:hypothetical protein
MSFFYTDIKANFEEKSAIGRLHIGGARAVRLSFAGIKRAIKSFCADLSVFAAVCVARFIVWRALRSRPVSAPATDGRQGAETGRLSLYASSDSGEA